MSDQSVRQMARRNARDAQRRLVAAREQREKRLSALGVQVVVALAERDAAVAEQEQIAGVALRSMTETEGLALREALKWCGEGLSVREGSRLRQLAVQDRGAHRDDSGGEQAGEVGGVGAGAAEWDQGEGSVE